MSKRKISVEDKIYAANLYLDGKESQRRISDMFDVSLASVQQWIRNYESMGTNAFTLKGNKKYSKELKQQAVLDYLAGCGSQDDICKKYGIRSKDKLQTWIKKYNGHEDHNYSVAALCKLGNVSRAAYYKWLHREVPKSEQKNRFIADEIEKIHTDSPDKGYRRIRDDLERYHGIDVNDKRVLRICRKLNIKSTIKYSNNGCTRQAASPQYIAENILNREFTAKAPNEKWLTDVTEFHYYIGVEKHKVYLSAILDLYDRRIVSYVIRDKNNNALVFDTVDNALLRNPGVQPLFHSDRGFQYTNRTFHTKLVNVGIIQSMSRVAKCIDNGPMEGFWGILKRERYYGKRFTDKGTLVKMIEDYIDYYNNKRLQRNLGILTPMEKHEIYLQAA